MLKLGILALRGGSWEGRQIVPEDWMVKSTQPQVPWSEGDAGYFGEQGRHGGGYGWCKKLTLSI